jgi:hypothetical protein
MGCEIPERRFIGHSIINKLFLLVPSTSNTRDKPTKMENKNTTNHIHSTHLNYTITKETHRQESTRETHRHPLTHSSNLFHDNHQSPVPKRKQQEKAKKPLS